jgi:hypothetical protein
MTQETAGAGVVRRKKVVGKGLVSAWEGDSLLVRRPGRRAAISEAAHCLESTDLQTAPAAMPDEPINACPKCGCRDLFIRKGFPQKTGLLVVVIAGLAFLFLAARRGTFYLGVWVLLSAAAVDALLYVFVPKITVCYRCRAEFRRGPLNPQHGPFELAVAEKYRSL